MNVFAYVDGLNLYHGMVDAGLLAYRWVDIRRVCEQMVFDARNRENLPFTLDAVTYCTSFVRNDKQAQSRQDLYVQALQSQNPQMTVLLGKYEEKTRDCECYCGCHNQVAFQKEKRTDVNLAVEMLRDAMSPNAPAAMLLITGDTDLVPAIQAVQARGLHVIVAAPPARHQDYLMHVSDTYVRVGRRQLRHSPLPAVVNSTLNGYPLTPPATWTHPDDW